MLYVLLLNCCYNNSVGDDAGARKDLDMAVACDPRCHLYRANRALLTRRCGDYSAAQEDYQV
jgi:Tfp pilus assembly protein PilF